MKTHHIIKIMAVVLVAVGIGVAIENSAPVEQTDYAETMQVAPVTVNAFITDWVGDPANTSGDNDNISLNSQQNTITMTGNHLDSLQLSFHYKAANGRDIFAGADNLTASLEAAREIAPKAIVNVDGAYVDGSDIELTFDRTYFWYVNVKNINVTASKDITVTFLKADTGLSDDIQMTVHIVHQ
ncbi:MAG: hypothetical protein LBT80_09600 [Lactobacillaceae bacterium]|nr:hypothetical protein [Lactobacillaceae bacterium]